MPRVMSKKVKSHSLLGGGAEKKTGKSRVLKRGFCPGIRGQHWGGKSRRKGGRKRGMAWLLRRKKKRV